MTPAIQIRDVPEDVHGRLVERARTDGVSLSQLLRRELAEIAARPSMKEVLARIASREPVMGGESPAAGVRAVRDERAGL